MFVDPVEPPKRALLIAAVLALLGFLVFNANLRLVGAGDSYPSRFLPFILIRDHTVSLESMSPLVAQGSPEPYWIEQRIPGPRVYSHYPVAVPVLLTPLYLPACAYLQWKGWTFERVERVAYVMEKLSASIVASLSMAVVFLLLSRRVPSGWAALLTIAYGFGSNTWMISSQALWQHGLSELALAAGLDHDAVRLLRSRYRRLFALIGLTMVACACAR